METANLALTKRWFEEVWNQGREETIDELFAPDGVGYGLGEQDTVIHGPEEFKLFARNMRTAFPDLRIRVEDSVAAGDKVSVRVVMEGTHRGDGLGMKATGKPMRVAGLIMLRLAHGQIAEGWNSWDQLGLLRQIGALGAPIAGDRFLTTEA